ncbi:MAG TPA: hypothetical protein VMB48_15385, partial [Steroidobacteraceae bacterium]|nr:hypothetical protein [Steroidobacteraceae bacterium]
MSSITATGSSGGLLSRLATLGAGRVLLALSLAIVGAIGLAAHDFVLSQQPVPAAVPFRQALACISGALLLLAGVGLLIAPVARLSALVLAGFVLLWVLVLQIPRVASRPLVEATWLGAGEDLSLACGLWITWYALAGRRDTLRIARAAFGVALIPIGLSHWFYLRDAAGLIPPWMPWRVPLAAFTGAAHIGAGCALALNILPRLAA